MHGTRNPYTDYTLNSVSSSNSSLILSSILNSVLCPILSLILFKFNLKFDLVTINLALSKWNCVMSLLCLPPPTNVTERHIFEAPPPPAMVTLLVDGHNGQAEGTA